MTLAIIVAMSKNRVIGRDQTIPWHLPHDLQHFRTLTTGHPIIMGRKTHASIGKALPDRKNIIITQDKKYDAPGCAIVATFTEALACAHPAPLIFAIGGARVYEEALPLADIIYLTLIDAVIEGDTYFPVLANEWHEQESRAFARDDKNAYDHRFITLVRKK